ncbi:hypothetical protein CC80DRAFT_511090 [Byssothecium circinans]|uniref:MYND-type domain-containing protein n=1 Tax=Byssothecium circinans TaxID=147558 RepID=A0A6A5T736_9PLEO|nr:hypothetical protein CC80DRAFT_511090 [Byssothecium circinans]
MPSQQQPAPSRSSTAAPPHEAVTATNPPVKKQPSQSPEPSHRTGDKHNSRAPSPVQVADALKHEEEETQLPRQLSQEQSEHALPCLMCPAPSKITCTNCNTVRYCSNDCKNLDVAAHGLLCKQWDTLQNRPGPTHRRTIYLAQSQFGGGGDSSGSQDNISTIRFVWVEFWTSKDEDVNVSEVPQLGEHFQGIPKKRRETHTVIKNEVLFRQLDHPLRVEVCQSQPWLEESSAHVFLDTKFCNPWQGPMLLYGAREITTDSFVSKDVNLQDLRHLLDYLNTFDTTALANDIRFFGETVRGVRVNCNGDRKEGNKFLARSEDVRIPLSHKLFSRQHPDLLSELPIPGKLGISILSIKVPRRPHFERYLTTYASEADLAGVFKGDHNRPFRDLTKDWLMDTDPDFLRILSKHNDAWRWSSDWLASDKSSEYFLGSVVLARKDNKPLAAIHVESLWRYIRFVLEPKMTEASDIHEDRDVSRVNELMSRDAFINFHSMVAAWHGDDEQWKCLSPFGVKRRRGSMCLVYPAQKFPPKKARYEWTSDGDVSDASDEKN